MKIIVTLKPMPPKTSAKLKLKRNPPKGAAPETSNTGSKDSVITFLGGEFNTSIKIEPGQEPIVPIQSIANVEAQKEESSLTECEEEDQEDLEYEVAPEFETSPSSAFSYPNLRRRRSQSGLGRRKPMQLY